MLESQRKSKRTICGLLRSKVRRTVVLGSLALLVAFNAAVAWKLFTGQAAADATASDSGYGNLTVFTRALQLIRQDYVDENRVSYKSLIYSALGGMLSSLDPHSQFLSPEEYRSLQEETKAQYGGIGLVLSSKSGMLTVATAQEDTPSFRAGIRPGDQLLRINGFTTERMPLQKALDRMRGPLNQKITLTIFHPTTGKTEDLSLQRELIKVATIKDAKLLEPSQSGKFKIGYLRITEFSEPTAADLNQRLTDLQNRGLQALIIDLRYNPGGLLNSAVDVCSQFLPPKTLVVSTEGRNAGEHREYFTDRAPKAHWTFPVILLINGQSASAAEIMAGTLKDLNRALLVGTTTFGKGSVQSLIPLSDGSALRLTTAIYRTPNNGAIQGRGVSPNIASALTANQEQALMLRRRSGPLPPEERKLADSEKDPQLDRAVDLLKGMMIYGRYSRSSPSASPKTER